MAVAVAVAVRVLGPIEAVSPAGSVALGGAKQRLVLVLLALADGRVVPTDRLVDSVWGERAAPTARRTLQVYVSTLRKACAAAGIEGETILRDGPGYRLAVPVQALDHARFAHLLSEGQRLVAEGDPARARQALREALELWRGPALGEVADEPAVAGEAQRLEELRLVCVEERIDADLELGGHAELVAELEGLVAHHPLRERLHGQLMLALYRSGRQAEALDTYQATRETLVEELGIEPGPKLHELHLRILNQDPALAAPERTASATPPLLRLPTPATTFIGREREIAEVVALLEREDLRLLTLTGPGGTGKTRLALQAARQSAPAFADGVVWVPLAPLRDPAYALSAIAQALEIQEQPPAPLQDTLREALEDRNCLLVLDNAEHLLPSLADDVSALREAPGPAFLVTSRERLDLQAERLYPVPSLRETEAVELFNERASYLDPAHDPEDPAIPLLCERLDSLPLALELAAARSDLYSPHELLEALAGHLELLRGARDHDPRHQTLQATIAWSYELLTPDDQHSFRALSVFAGGCTAEAACEVAGADPALLQSLVAKSLLRTRETPSGRRYWMLETIREYAASASERDGEANLVRQRHAEYYCQLAIEAGPLLEGKTLAETISRLSEDADNLRTALPFACEHDAELTLQAASALLGLLLYRVGLAREVSELIRDILERFPHLPDGLRASGIFALGSIANVKGDRDVAEPLLDQAIELLRAVEDPRKLASALNNRARLASLRGDSTAARLGYQESSAIFSSLGDDFRYAVTLGNLGGLTAAEGEYSAARPMLEESLELLRDSPPASISPLVELAIVDLCEGDPVKARRYAVRARDLCDQLDAEQKALEARSILARCELGTGDVVAAQGLLRANVEYLRVNEDDHEQSLLACATFASAVGAASECLQLLGATETADLRAAFDVTWREELLVAARATLEPPEIEARIAEGRALTRAQALELAQHVLDGSTSKTG